MDEIVGRTGAKRQGRSPERPAEPQPEDSAPRLIGTVAYHASDIRLIERLAEGLAEYQAGNQQAGTAIQLAGVVDWLNRKEAVQQTGLAEPLNKLVMMLADVANGKLPPFLKPQRSKGRRGRPRHPSHDLRKAAGAHAVDLLIQEGGCSRAEASQFVAHEFNNANIKPATVLGWRDEMGSRNSGMSAEWYRQLVTLGEVPPELSPTAEDRVRAMIRHLKTLV